MIDATSLRGLAAAALLLCGVGAQANSADAIANLELTNISTSGTATFDIDGGFHTGAAVLNDTSGLADFDFFFGDAPGAAIASAGDNAAVANSLADGANASVVAIGSGDALASSATELDFTVDGMGEVILTFSASLSGFADGNDAFAQASAVVYDVFGGFDEAFLFIATAADSASATLMLTLDVDGFATGFLGIEASAFADSGVAAVPVPAAGWLFVGGLLALARARRRAA